MAKVHERVLAWVSVLVVLIGVGALSAASIIQQIITDHQTAAASQTATTNTCTDDQTESTLPTPAAYTVSGRVSNLQSTDISMGNGATAQNDDCLVVKYYGTLATNGTVFDETYTKPTAFAFRLGQGQVIPGWDKGVLGMKVGGERRLVIPASLAYGNQAAGSIPADSDLVFYVKLLRIQQ